MEIQYKTYDELNDSAKKDLMDLAIRCLSLKPELVGSVSGNKELIDGIITFSKTLYEYFPVKKSTVQVVNSNGY